MFFVWHGKLPKTANWHFFCQLKMPGTVTLCTIRHAQSIDYNDVISPIKIAMRNHPNQFEPGGIFLVQLLANSPKPSQAASALLQEKMQWKLELIGWFLMAILIGEFTGTDQSIGMICRVPIMSVIMWMSKHLCLWTQSCTFSGTLVPP